MEFPWSHGKKIGKQDSVRNSFSNSEKIRYIQSAFRSGVHTTAMNISNIVEQLLQTMVEILMNAALLVCIKEMKEKKSQ